MARAHHIVLVPGFFGFANLGDFTYFGHVRDLLLELGPPLGVEGEVSVVFTEPTASLTRRAALLCETVSGLLDRAPGRVSLIGHSSGGLDARLLCTPGRDPAHRRRPRALRPRRPGAGHRRHPAPRHAAGPGLLRPARAAVAPARLAHHHPRAPHRPAPALGGAAAGPPAALREGAALGRPRPALQAAAGRLLRRAPAHRGGLPLRRAQRPGAGRPAQRRPTWRSSTPRPRTGRGCPTAAWSRRRARRA